MKKLKDSSLQIGFALSIALITITLGSCIKNLPEPNYTDFSQLRVPTDFNYETGDELLVSITDSYEGAKYQIYSYSTADEEPEIVVVEEDTIIQISNSNQLITQGLIRDGSWTAQLTLPGHQDYVYLRRYADGAWSGEVLEITGTTLEYHHQGMKMKSGQTEERIYTMNNEKDLGYFSLTDFSFTELGRISIGSSGIAINKADNLLYICNKAKKELYKYDLSTGETTKIMKLSVNHYNLDYRADEGLLYTMYKKRTYTIDPFTGKYVSSYYTRGHKEKTNSDIAFDPDNYLYSVGKDLYKVKITGENNTCTLVKKGLGKTFGAAVYASDGYIYAGFNKNVYKIDPGTGEIEDLFDMPYDTDDFALMAADAQQSNPDADADGVPDDADDYPNDAERAYNTWYPGQNSFGSLAYEDLWPSRGDYDFNDLVIDYKFKQIKNADNEIIAIGARFKVRAIGGSKANGFGFQLDITPNQVSELISDYTVSAGDLSFDDNGLESNQEKATVIVFGDGFNLLPHPGTGSGVNTNVANSFVQPVTVYLEVLFTSAVSEDDLGSAPYNAFIFRTADRGREIHLPGYAPTDMVNESYFGTENDATNLGAGYYYKTQLGHPWGMNLPISFTYPLEKVSILEGYLRFGQWAASGGFSYMDWYTEQEGYRSDTRLYIRE